MSFNKIILVGNLGRDPELRYTPQGSAVCSFSMATNERRKDKSGEFQNIATWFRVTLWGNQAEIASKYLTKGKQVYIEGRLRMDEYTDREGVIQKTLEVNGTDMQFIGSREDGAGNYGGGQTDRDDHDTHTGPPQDSTASGASAGSSTPPATGGNGPAADDDIPF